MTGDLFTDSTPRFDSGIRLERQDHARLHKGLDRVREVMGDGIWRTVPTIRMAILKRFSVMDPETSISANLRNLRKERFGSHTVERRRVGNFYQFRLAAQSAEEGHH